MMMTKDQAETVAAAVHAVRPEWDERGILTALGKARERGPAWAVAAAALIAAGRPENRTPAVIPLAGEHWSHTVGEKRGTDGRTEPRCQEHPYELAWNCRWCRADEIGGVPYTRTPKPEPEPRKAMPRIPNRERETA